MYSLADMAEICRMHRYMYIKMKYRYLKETAQSTKHCRGLVFFLDYVR